MPGVLSSIFDSGEGGSHHDSSVTSLEGNGGLAVDQDIDVDATATYQDADGGTHTWAFENDVGIHADASATVAAVLATEDSASGIGG